MAREVISFDKFPEEVVDQSIDFTDQLSAGEIVSSGDINVYDRSGTDVTSTILSGSVSVANNVSVEYTLTGGTAGELYTITVLATLSSNEIIGQRLRMRVTPPG